LQSSRKVGGILNEQEVLTLLRDIRLFMIWKVMLPKDEANQRISEYVEKNHLLVDPYISK
jgi:hypothetical protein